MADDNSPADGTEKEKRFRGSWAPLIRDPAKFAFLDLNPTVSALERAAEAHEQDALADPGEEEKQDEPPVLAVREANGPAKATEVEKEVLPRTVRSETVDPLLIDAEFARHRVEALHLKHPEKNLDALCEILIQTKCKQGALVGLCTAAPAMLVPGWGSLASVLLGGVADLTLTTKLECDLALEIACLYNLYEVYCTDQIARRTYLLHVAGLEGIDDHVLHDDDERATRTAGERVASRATEEVGKRSLVRYVPVVGATVSAGTNVVGIYVIGRRAQQICRGNSVGTWQESVNQDVVPSDISRMMALQMSRVPSAVTVRVAQVTTRIGAGVKTMMVTSTSTRYYH